MQTVPSSNRLERAPNAPLPTACAAGAPAHGLFLVRSSDTRVFQHSELVTDRVDKTGSQSSRYERTTHSQTMNFITLRLFVKPTRAAFHACRQELFSEACPALDAPGPPGVTPPTSNPGTGHKPLNKAHLR